MNSYTYDELKDTHKMILPVPFPENTVPSAPSGVDYGSSPQPMPLKPYPNSKNDKMQYCNELPPAPRSQDLNMPYQGPYCPFYNKLPFEKDACYLATNEAQGVTGLVCNSAGGSDNANFARGNQFGVDYKWNQSDQFKKKNKTMYATQSPDESVQMKLKQENPLVVYDKNTFYPQPDWKVQQNKNYQTYMEPTRFTPQGLPTYTYPYQVDNPMKPLTPNEYEQKMTKKMCTNDPVIGDYPKNVPYNDFKPGVDIDLEDRNATMVPQKEKDMYHIENFQNMSCPHRQNCPRCQNCPFKENCQCGSRCPYCVHCPIIKRLVLENFSNQMEVSMKSSQQNSLLRIVSIILIILMFIYLIPIIQKMIAKS